MGPQGTPGLFVDPNTAMTSASNIFVWIEGVCARSPARALSRVGVDFAVVDHSDGSDINYRRVGRGPASYPDITLQLDPSCWTGAHTWFSLVSNGSDARRPATISIADWTTNEDILIAALFDAIPTSFDFETGTITLKFGRMALVNGTAPGSGAPYTSKLTHNYVMDLIGKPEIISASMVTGGGIAISVDSNVVGSDQQHTYSTGLRSVTPLSARLHGAPPVVFDLMNRHFISGDSTVTVSVTQLSGAFSNEYTTAFPTRFTFINPLVPLVNGRMPLVLDLTMVANLVTTTQQ